MIKISLFYSFVFVLFGGFGFSLRFSFGLDFYWCNFSRSLLYSYFSFSWLYCLFDFFGLFCFFNFGFLSSLRGNFFTFFVFLFNCSFFRLRFFWLLLLFQFSSSFSFLCSLLLFFISCSLLFSLSISFSLLFKLLSFFLLFKLR